MIQISETVALRDEQKEKESGRQRIIELDGESASEREKERSKGKKPA